MGSSTVVENLPHHANVKGLSPATVAGTGRDNMARDSYLKLIALFTTLSSAKCWFIIS
jgi:hypothetical protein